jgi:hypothetical protein
VPIENGIHDSIDVVSDGDLLEFGDWADDEKEKIQIWIGDPTGIKAIEAITFSLERRLEPNYEPKPEKIKNIKDNLAHFEDLVSTIRSGLRNEYYQEHLSHMLRVALLANAIGNRVECLNLNHDVLNRLTVAALVHDISYPLSYSRKTFEGIKDKLEKCYSCANFTDIGISYNMKMVFENLKCFSDWNLADIGTALDEYDHGMLSAIEFLTYIKAESRKDFRDVALAVAVHSGGSPLKCLPYSKHPLAVLLILCDELQQAGRLIGTDKKPLIDEIELDLTNGIHCVIDYSGKDEGPSFAGTLKNLQRIDFKGFDCPLCIRTVLPNVYDSIDIPYLLACMYDLYAKLLPTDVHKRLQNCEQSIINKITEEDADLYFSHRHETLIKNFTKDYMGMTQTYSVYFREAGLDFFVSYDKPKYIQFSVDSTEKLLVQAGFSNRSIHYADCDILNKGDRIFIEIKYIKDILSCLIEFILYEYTKRLILHHYHTTNDKAVGEVEDIDNSILESDKKLSSLKKVYDGNPPPLKYYISNPEIEEDEKEACLDFVNEHIKKLNKDSEKDITDFLEFIKKFDAFYECFDDDKDTVFLKTPVDSL